jgi:hypothetical protein
VFSLAKLSLQTISFILILSIASLSSEVFAQSGLRINDQIGGSGNNTTQSDNSNDDAFLYVMGGLVIAGILVYALVIKKDNKSSEDSTKSVESKLRVSELDSFSSPELELQKVKEKIPVDLFMGIRNNEAVMNDKTYLLGLRVKI